MEQTKRSEKSVHPSLPYGNLPHCLAHLHNITSFRQIEVIALVGAVDLHTQDPHACNVVNIKRLPGSPCHTQHSFTADRNRNLLCFVVNYLYCRCSLHRLGKDTRKQGYERCNKYLFNHTRIPLWPIQPPQPKTPINVHCKDREFRIEIPINWLLFHIG